MTAPVIQKTYKRITKLGMSSVGRFPLADFYAFPFSQPAGLSAIAPLHIALLARLSEMMVSQKLTKRFDAASVEAVTNAAQHALAGTDIAATLLVYQLAGYQVCVLIVENRIDPAAAIRFPKIKDLLPLNQYSLQERGRGIPIMRQCADGFHITAIIGRSVHVYLTFAEPIQP